MKPPPLPRELAQAIARATDDAVKRKHAVVRPAHILAALVRPESIRRRLRARGVDADHLFASVERAVNQEPTSSAYRDGSAPAQCPSIERALARKRGFLRPRLDLLDVVEALGGVPELTGSVREQVIDVSEIAPIVDAATARAIERGEMGPDWGDGFAALVAHQPSFRDAALRAGVSPERACASRGGSFVAVCDHVVSIMARSGYAAITPGVVLAQLLAFTRVAWKLEPRALAYVLEELVHGPPVEEDVGDDEEAEIVFVDDPMTTFDLVVQILVEMLGPDEPSAADSTAVISAEGEAVVSRRCGREAKEMKRRAIAWARREGFPLRVIVRARA